MSWVHPSTVAFWVEDPGFQWQVEALESSNPALHADFLGWFLHWEGRPWAEFERAGQVSFIAGSFNSTYSSVQISAVDGQILIAGIATYNVLAPMTFYTPSLPDSPHYPPTDAGDIP